MSVINRLNNALVFWSSPCDTVTKKVEHFPELTTNDGVIMG